MKVSFIGCPSSGKTTLAFKLYAALKERGAACEFLQEQARLYIAMRRVALGAGPDSRLVLADAEQRTIMERQLRWESTMTSACGPNVLLVTDSSPLNSMLYMPLSLREECRGLASLAVQAGNIVFYCAPVSASDAVDPNRIHTAEEAHRVDQQIMPVLADYAPFVLNNMIALDGDLEDRFNVMFQTVLGATT